MFSKIPARFSAPFGLLGDEAKLAFPSQPNGILKLAAVRVRIPGFSYWLDTHPKFGMQNIPSLDSYWEQVGGARLYAFVPN
jgi:hypothetical protein